MRSTARVLTAWRRSTSSPVSRSGLLRNLKTAVQIDGKDLYLGVNAYVYAEPKAR